MVRRVPLSNLRSKRLHKTRPEIAAAWTRILNLVTNAGEDKCSKLLERKAKRYPTPPKILVTALPLQRDRANSRQ